jgi:hypothetical protein
MKLVKDEQLQVLHQQFDTECAVQVSIRKMQVNQVLQKLSAIKSVISAYNHSS